MDLIKIALGDYPRYEELLLRKDKFEAQEQALLERKDVVIQTTDGEETTKPFSRIQFFNDNGFRFVNVVEKSGWTNSYRVDDLTKLVIE